MREDWFLRSSQSAAGIYIHRCCAYQQQREPVCKTYALRESSPLQGVKRVAIGWRQLGARERIVHTQYGVQDLDQQEIKCTVRDPDRARVASQHCRWTGKMHHMGRRIPEQTLQARLCPWRGSEIRHEKGNAGSSLYRLSDAAMARFAFALQETSEPTPSSHHGRLPDEGTVPRRCLSMAGKQGNSPEKRPDQVVVRDRSTLLRWNYPVSQCQRDRWSAKA